MQPAGFEQLLDVSRTKADQLFFDQVTETAKADEDMGANSFDNFAHAIDDVLLDLVIDRMDPERRDHLEASKPMNEPEVRRIAFREMARRIYEGARGQRLFASLTV